MKLRVESKSRLLVFLYRILLLLVFLAISRAIYMVMNWSYFAPISSSELLNIFRGGVMFDLCSLTYISSIFILLTFIGGMLPYRIEMNRWYRLFTNLFYIIAGLLNIIVNIADAGYYPFSLKRLQMDVLTEFAGDNMLKILASLSVSFWYYSLIIIGLSILFVWLYYRVSFVRKSLTNSKSDIRKHKKNILGNIAIFLGVLLILFMNLRGWYSLKSAPINSVSASKFCNKPQHRVLVLNSIYTFIRTSLKPVMKELNYFPKEKLAELFDPHFTAKPLSPDDSIFGSMKGRNIVFVILESFGAEYTGFYNKSLEDYPSYTPFLDSLASDSYTFEYGYANGRKSVQAMPSALVSLPSMGFKYVDSNYATNRLKGLPELLSLLGYTSTFYHGGVNGTMGFDAFTKSIGFNRYFGKNEYNNNRDYDGVWGIFDEPFLQRVASEINKSSSPSLSVIFTLSSHTPCTIPTKYKNVFASGSRPMYNAISYSDMALRKFFNSMKSSKEYKNTLFILMADHCSVSDQLGYANLPGRYRIPIIFFDPQGKLKGLRTDIVAQQADILPTLLYLLGYSTPIITYGNNVFNNDAKHFAIEGEGDIYYMITNDYTISFDPNSNNYKIEEPIPLVQCYKKDINNWAKNPRYKNAVDTLKAIIQDYRFRLIHDDMVVK